MVIYENIRSRLLMKLQEGLPENLLYHNIEHTNDVIKHSEKIAIEEGITPENIFLLKVAALYHDSGFLETYKGHEAVGCRYAKADLPAFGFSHAELDIICGLIMATKVPQTPLTLMERIICDADLDYLGRTDFFPVSNNLFLELKARDMITTEKEWNLRQVNFFRQHHYFTATNKKLRDPKKQEHLAMIEAML